MMRIARISLLAALLAGMAAAQTTIHGILLDGGCRDRSKVNLRRPPEKFTPATPVQQAPASKGITVDQQTAQNERQDVVMHMVPDLASRQSDPTCAVTAGTRAYAILLDNGTFVDLDEAGTTFAADAVASNPQGRDMLNGRSWGFKSTVEVKGRIVADRLSTQSLVIK